MVVMQKNQKRDNESDDRGADDEATARILQAIEEAGGEAADYEVFVYRISGPNKKRDGKEARLFTCGVGDLDGVPDRLGYDFGEGTYRFRVRKDGRLVGRFWDMEIELSLEGRRAFNARERGSLAIEPSESRPIVATAPAAIGGGDTMTMVLKMMENQNDLILGLLTKQNIAPAVVSDPMASFKSTMDAFAAFQAALPRGETASGLKSLETAMDIIERMDKGGNSREPASVLGLVRELLGNPEIVGVFKQALAQPPRAPATIAPPPAQPANTLEDQGMAYLIGQANAGIQPELCAETAARMIPDGIMQMLDQMSPEQAIDYMQRFYPAVKDHRPWFAALIGALYETEAPASPEAGNAGDGEHREPNQDAGAIPHTPAS